MVSFSRSKCGQNSTSNSARTLSTARARNSKLRSNEGCSHEFYETFVRRCVPHAEYFSARLAQSAAPAATEKIRRPGRGPSSSFGAEPDADRTLHAQGNARRTVSGTSPARESARRLGEIQYGRGPHGRMVHHVPVTHCSYCSMPATCSCEIGSCRIPLCSKCRVRKFGGNLCRRHRHNRLVQTIGIPNLKFANAGIARPHGS